MLLLTYEVDKGNYEVDCEYRTFICMLNLDYIDPDVSLSKMIKVHPVTCERATEKGYGIQTTDVLPFAPSKLALNSTENAFILYGERGIFVGNFASDLRNMDH